MKLAVGLITYNNNSFKYLNYFWPSLEKALKKSNSDFAIYVWDNSDINYLANEDFFKNKTVNFIRSFENIGFAAAYNKIIRGTVDSGFEYFLMINPDILIDEFAIFELLETLTSDDNIAAVVPKILRWDFVNNTKTNIIDSKGLGIDYRQHVWDIDQGKLDDGQLISQQVFGFSGAAALLRLKSLEEVSFENREYFDELMFMYKEDVDLSFRLFLGGFKTIYQSKALIYHDRTVSSTGNGLLKALLNRKNKHRLVKSWSFRSQLIIFHRYINLKLPIIYKIAVVFYQFKSWIYVLFFENYLLKDLKFVWQNLSEMRQKRNQLIIRINLADVLKIYKK